MEVDKIPIPAVATIKVSKEGKVAVFGTTVVQTTDNKYIYVMPIRSNNKLVNFGGPGLLKEIKIRFSENEIYVWKNITIVKFVENGNLFLRIKTRTPGVFTNVWQENIKKIIKKKRIVSTAAE